VSYFVYSDSKFAERFSRFTNGAYVLSMKLLQNSPLWHSTKAVLEELGPQGMSGDETDDERVPEPSKR